MVITGNECPVSCPEQPERMRSSPAVRGQDLASQALLSYCVCFASLVCISTYTLQLFAVTNRFSAACEELQQGTDISRSSQRVAMWTSMAHGHTHCALPVW